MLSTASALRFAVSACLSAVIRRRALNCLWELTYRCNARCAFCDYWRHPSSAGAELSALQIEEGLRKVRAAGCRLVNFTGGEPTLRPDLPEIVNAAARQGLWTSMVTNGSLLTRQNVKALRSAGLCNLLVSLDSTIATEHNEHRGVPHLFEKVERCMHWLLSDFLGSYRTGGIMWVIRAGNVRLLNEIADWADRRGIFVVFQPQHRKKTGLESGSDVSSPLASSSVLLDLRRLHKSILNSSGYLSGAGSFMANGAAMPRCQAGRKYFSVDPLGYLHPCVDLPARGHVLKDSLDVLRTPQAQNDVGNCAGCWYCFRGEADCSLGLRGCLSKMAVASRVLWRNATAAPAAKTHRAA